MDHLKSQGAVPAVSQLVVNENPHSFYLMFSFPFYEANKTQ
jgi:hypothetical protein